MPRATSCRAGSLVVTPVKAPLANSLNTDDILRLVVEVGWLSVADEVTGLPQEYRGANVSVLAKVVGTTVGLDGRELIRIVSGPIWMVALTILVFAKSMVNEWSLMLVKGVGVVPAPQFTDNTAGAHTRLPTPQPPLPGVVGTAPPSEPPAVCTLNSLLSANDR